MKTALVLMAILTAIYVSAVVYASINSNHSSDATSLGKEPIEYGIWRHYFAERLETEPQEWYTPEELGIILVESKVIEGRYHIFIADEEKALPWMNGTTPEPYAVKYGDNFYRVLSLWVTPGLSESIKQWQVSMGVALGACWIFAGALLLKERKKK